MNRRKLFSKSRMAASLCILGIGLLGTLAGCTTAQPTSGQMSGLSPQPVSATSERALVAYQRTIGTTRRGAFAISQDGKTTFYSYCAEITCIPANYSMLALNGCRSLSGSACNLLFVNRDARIAFERAALLNDSGKHGAIEVPPAYDRLFD